MTERLLQGLAFGLPLVFNPWGTLAFEPFKITLIRLAAMTLAVCWALDFTPSGWRSPGARRLWLAALIYLVSTALSTSTSIQPLQSLLGSFDRLQGLLTLLALAIIALAVASLPAQKVERLIDWLLAGSALVCLYALVQQFRLDPLPWLERTLGPHSTVGSSTALGGYLAMLAPLTVARAVNAGRELTNSGAAWRSLRAGRLVALLVLVGLQAAVVFLSGVRGALLGLVAGLVGLVVLRLWHSPRCGAARLLLGSVAAGLVGAATLALLVLPADSFRTFSPYLERLAGSDPSDFAARDRLLIWQAALEIVSTSDPRLLFGFGPETQSVAFEARFPIELANRLPNLRFDRAHNVFLDHLLSGGALVLAAYGGLLFAAIAIGRRELHGRSDNWLPAALLSSLVAHMVEGLFAFGSATTLFVFWLELGLLAGLCGGPRAAPTPRAASGRRLRTLPAGIAAAGLCLPVVLSPVAADLAYTRALAYQGGKDAIGEIVWTRRAVALAPDRDLYQIALGVALADEVLQQTSADRRRALLEEAESVLRRAVAQNPREPYNLYHLGQLVELRSQAESKPEVLGEAAELFDRAAGLSPNRSLFHDAAGLAMHKQGRWEAALARYQRAGDLQGPSAERSARQGDSLLALGRLQDAQARYNSALELTPRSAATHAGLARLLRRQGDLTGAVEAARLATRFQFRDWRHRELLAQLEREAGNHQAALVQARAAARLGPPWERQRLRELVEELRQDFLSRIPSRSGYSAMSSGLSSASMGSPSSCLSCSALTTALAR